MVSPKQDKFCTEYITCGIAREAYQRAFGGNEHTARVNASKLLQRPAIQQRIRELQAELASAKIITAQELQERLTRIARREETEVVYLPNGTQVERPAQIRDSLKALEMLAKINGLFLNRTELDIRDVAPVIIVDDVAS